MVSHAWYNENVSIVSKEINLAQTHPWAYHQLVTLGKTVANLNIDCIPPDAEADRRAFVQLGIKSALSIPLVIVVRVHHIIVVHALKRECIWSESFIKQLRLLGEIFVSALERRDILYSLQRYQARLDVAAASAGAALWELDLATGIFWATDKARELFGFAPDECITLSGLLAKIHPEDRGLVAETVERTQDLDAALQVEYRVPGSNGSIRWLTSRGRMQQIGESALKCLTGVTLEITQRKQMEQKLRDQVQEISRLREQLEQENTLLRAEAGLNQERHHSLGISGSMQRVKELVEQVAQTGSTVLIQGETGTGKELIAQAIHQLSPRNKRDRKSVV